MTDPERSGAKTEQDDAIDPVMRRIFRWPLPITAIYLLAGLSVAVAVKWQGINETDTPGWLWAVWVLLVGPMLVSVCWRAVVWIRSSYRRREDTSP